MKTRISLQRKFEDLLGSKNVYFQPPESLKMKYPCIRYSLSDVDKRLGDNIAYSMTNCYDVICISEDPENEIVRKILEMPMSSFDRHYVSNNLYHDVIKIYY